VLRAVAWKWLVMKEAFKGKIIIATFIFALLFAFLEITYSFFQK
jgi:hypothetical protein